MVRPDANHWLLVSFDQWRGDWLNQSALQLPTLQRLARRSLVAERCLTASPQCVPARASWLTGLWPSELGITRNADFTLSASSPSFVRSLQQHGWHTALIGKTHWHSHAAGVDLRDQVALLQELGFQESNEIAGPRALAEVHCALTDAWEAHQPGLQARYRDDLAERYQGGSPWCVRPSILPLALYPDVWVADQACSWLQHRGPSEQPWMLWVSFPGPHEPWDTPKPWAGLHQRRRLPTATPRPTWIQRQPLHSECRQRQLQWANGPDDDAITALRCDYADHLSLLDHQLGRLLALLAEPERTAVTVVSDHGELLGDAGFLYKSCFLEGSIRSLALHHRPGQRGWRRRWRDPVGLSWFLGAAAADVSGQRAMVSNPMPKFVFSEFGEELLVSNRCNKLIMDRSGEPLWATNICSDPNEQINLVEMSSELRGDWLALHKAGLEHCTLF